MLKLRLLRSSKICIKEYFLSGLYKYQIITSNKYIDDFLKKKGLGSKENKKKDLSKANKMESDNKNEGDLFAISDDSYDFDEGNKKKEKNIMVNENRMKLNRKLAQGIKVLTTSEKKSFEQIVQEAPSKNLIVIHFGNGDEDDFMTLEKFTSKYGSSKVHIFPGIGYGLVEFEKEELAAALINDSQKVPENMVANSVELKFYHRVRNIFFFFSRLSLEEMNRVQCFNFPNAETKSSVPGLVIQDEFISESEEKDILSFIDSQPWIKLANRRVQHYGYEFLYGINSIDKEKPAPKPIPEYFSNVLKKIFDLTKDTQPLMMDQLTINDYMPGDGIPPHFDTHSPFEEKFVSLSVGSGIVMTFKSYKNEERHLFLPSRSLVMFSGESRFAWLHSISARKIDKINDKLIFRRRRISLTFRRIRKEPCKCIYPFFCDSQGYDPVTMKKNNPLLPRDESAIGKDEVPKTQEEEKILEEVSKLSGNQPTELEKKYVYDIYEKIAPHFSHTRYKPWPKIEEFLNSLEPGSMVADIGCGNGKYLGVNQNVFTFGSDRSENLIEICKTRDKNFQVFSSDNLRLPIRSGGMDVVLSIAVIHHFSNKALRIHAITELLRLLRKDGLLLIYVWAFEQEERKFTEQDVFVPWNLQYKFEDEKVLENISKQESRSSGGQKEEGDDLIVNEEKKTIVYKRYYHVFKKGELEDLVKDIPNIEIVESFYDHANWCAKIRKLN